MFTNGRKFRNTNRTINLLVNVNDWISYQKMDSSIFRAWGSHDRTKMAASSFEKQENETERHVARSIDKNAKERNETATSNVSFAVRTPRRSTHKQTATLRSACPPPHDPLTNPRSHRSWRQTKETTPFVISSKITNIVRKRDILYARPLCTTWCNLFNARNLVACFSWQFVSREHVVTSSFL